MLIMCDVDFDANVCCGDSAESEETTNNRIKESDVYIYLNGEVSKRFA
jgi:hypothetical protein